MKNRSLTIIVLLVTSFALYSQEQEEKKNQTKNFHIALNAGGNLSIPVPKEDILFEGQSIVRENSLGIGFFSELALSYTLSKKINICLNSGYSLVRHKYKIELLGTEEGYIKINGITNNLLINYQFPKTGMYIGLGAYYTYNFKAIEEGTNDFSNTEWTTPDDLGNSNQNSNDPLIPKDKVDFNRDITKNIKPNEFGLVVEFGKYFKLSDNLKLNTFIRYNQSLVNIYPENINPKLYQMYLSVGFGLVY